MFAMLIAVLCLDILFLFASFFVQPVPQLASPLDAAGWQSHPHLFFQSTQCTLYFLQNDLVCRPNTLKLKTNYLRHGNLKLKKDEKVIISHQTLTGAMTSLGPVELPRSPATRKCLSMTRI
jgi:hypothetical protein